MNAHTTPDGEAVATQDAATPVSGIGTADFYDELWSRNRGVITPREQAVLQSMRVLCAGCGTVGASVAEPLARLGVCAFVLADPEAYDVTNLNRQRAGVGDLGRPKARVVAERILSINPHAELVILDEGLTPGNIDSAMRGVTAVFEGVDAFSDLWVKYLVHETAARRRIPVLSGVDYGGKPTVYVFDYRHDPRPFYGKASAADHREGRTLKALSWLGYRPIPADFVPAIESNLTTGQPWPQVSYCADALGALGSRTMLDLVLGRPVREIVSTDVHLLTMPIRRRLLARARWPLVAARTVLRLRLGTLRGERDHDALAGLPRELRYTADAARRAPSAHNTQPWRLRVTASDRLVLDWDRRRDLPVVDVDRRGLCYGLGCALEAAARVSDLSYEPSGAGDPHDADWYAGEIIVHGVRDETYARSSGILAARGTNRGPFLRDPVDPGVLRRMEERAAAHGVRAAAMVDRSGIARLAELTTEAATAQLEQEPFLDELLRWIRTTRHEWDWDLDGFTPETLRLNPVIARVIRALKASPSLRAFARRAGLARAMAAAAGKTIEETGAVVLLSHADRSPQGCIGAGRGMLASWLVLTEENLSVQPVNFAIGLEDARARVLEHFGANPEDATTAILRVGYATEPPPPSPRLPLDRVCVLESPLEH
jgi:molybdopterin/thiamine biosynthesis adenylyltransferase/nitroreductase